MFYFSNKEKSKRVRVKSFRQKRKSCFSKFILFESFLDNKMLGFYHKTLLITYFVHPKEKNRERFNEIKQNRKHIHTLGLCCT